MNIDELMNEEEISNVSRETLEGEEPKKQMSFNFLKTPSLDKSLEEYLNHPLNKSHDEDLGQGLRGIEAFLGNTNLAIIDLFGFVKYIFKNKSKKEVDVDA